MRVKYRVSVDHRGNAPGGVVFEFSGETYSISVANGKVTEIQVVVPNFPMSALPRMTPPSKQGDVPEISIPLDPVWPNVEHRLMFLEGVLSMFGLKKIAFEERIVEWLPETEMERDAVQISSFRATRQKKNDAGPVAYDMFARSLIICKRLSYLEVALNFNRRGKEDLGDEKYVLAIYNFYFVIESLFADGKFKKKDVLENFLASDRLVSSVEKAKLALGSDSVFVRELTSERSNIYVRGAPREVLGQLIDIRGYLHHHSGKRLNSWHPHRSDEYRVDAIFLAQVCFCVLGGIVFEEMYSKDSIDEFSKIDFLSPDGKKISFVPLSN